MVGEVTVISRSSLFLVRYGRRCSEAKLKKNGSISTHFVGGRIGMGGMEGMKWSCIRLAYCVDNVDSVVLDSCGNACGVLPFLSAQPSNYASLSNTHTSTSTLPFHPLDPAGISVTSSRIPATTSVPPSMMTRALPFA